MGEIEAPPALLVQRFGPPRPGDSYKVSGEYVFADSSAQPFVVHDWKSTHLWSAELPPPAEFWSSWKPTEMSISSRDVPVKEFEHWLLQQLTGDSAV